MLNKAITQKEIIKQKLFPLTNLMPQMSQKQNVTLNACYQYYFSISLMFVGAKVHTVNILVTHEYHYSQRSPRRMT